MDLKTFRFKRRLAAWLQAAVLLGLPFVRIRGESALRFDIPTVKLYFFGSVVWIGEAYFYLLIFLLFFIAIMLFTVLYGRIWCGWACPQTLLSDVSGFLRNASARCSGHPLIRMVLSHTLLILFSILVAANLIWYFVPPRDMLRDAMSFSPGPWTLGSWVFFTVLLYIDLAFVRQRFCGAVCPYARLQSAFFDRQSLTIAFDRERVGECSGCEACVRNCPAGIDIRKGLQVECINCAECIDACSGVRGRSGKPSLVEYRFGNGTGADGVMRPRVIWLSVLLSALIVLFVHQIRIRIPVDFWVVRDDTQPFHQKAVRDNMMNTYDVLVENRSLDPAEYLLTVSGVKDLDLVISRNPFVIPPNSIVQLRIYLFIERKNLAYRVTPLRFSLENTSRHEIRITRETSFLFSERSDRGVEI